MNPYLAFFVGGFAGGIALRSLFPNVTGNEPFLFGIFLLVLALSLFLVARIKKVALFSLLMLGAVALGSLGLGVVRYDISELHKGDPFLEEVVEKEVVLRGVVIDEPDIRESHTKFTVLARLLEEEKGLKKSVESKVLVTASHFPEYRYGDQIILRGTLLKPQNFKGEEEARTFDYISYLAKSGIYYQMFYPESEFEKGSEGVLIREKLFALKELFLENTRKVIPEPASSLLGGVVVGAKQSLGEELLDDFRKTGIIHIVVLSGYNITIVAEAIGRLAVYAPRVLALTASTGAIVAFALMTGAGATIVRASIMALLVLYARASGRIYAITSALFVAGFLMLVHNPKILIFDPSFQLSFLATIGLIYFSPRIEEFFSKIPNTFGIRSVIGATLSTQIFVLPLLLYMMGEISLVAVPVNLLILLFIPATMLLGFLTAVFGLLGTLVSLPFAYITYALLAYELKIVDLFASLPFASLSIGTFSFMWVIFFYALYLWLIWRGRNKRTSQIGNST